MPRCAEINVYRGVQEFGLFIRGSYITMSDSELDNIISDIKSQMQNASYGTVQCHLVSMGLRVQCLKMMSFMHLVDAEGRCFTLLLPVKTRLFLPQQIY